MSPLLRGATSRSVRKHRIASALAAWKANPRASLYPVMPSGSPPPARKRPLPTKRRRSWAKRRAARRLAGITLVLVTP